MYICIYIYVYMYICIYVYMCVYMYVYMYVYMTNHISASTNVVWYILLYVSISTILCILFHVGPTMLSICNTKLYSMHILIHLFQVKTHIQLIHSITYT